MTSKSYKVEYNLYLDRNCTELATDKIGNIVAGQEHHLYFKNTGEATLLEINFDSTFPDLEPVSQIKSLRAGESAIAFTWKPGKDHPVSLDSGKVTVRALAAPDW